MSTGIDNLMAETNPQTAPTAAHPSARTEMAFRMAKPPDNDSASPLVPFSSETAHEPNGLADLIDLDQMQLLLDSYSDAVGMSGAILDVSGKILVASRWRDICTRFHRVNEQTAARCLESDTLLGTELKEGEKFSLYQCHNGLNDAAAPIVIDGRRLGSIYVGQFLIEPPDKEFFRRQAASFGFDEKAYLQALANVPVVPSGRLRPILGFLTRYAEILASIGTERLRQESVKAALARRAAELDQGNQELRRQRAEAISLAEDASLQWAAAENARQAIRESEQQLRKILAFSPLPIAWSDMQGKVELWNHKAVELFGYTAAELRTTDDWFRLAYPDPEYRERAKTRWRNAVESASQQHGSILPDEYTVTCKDGSVRNVEILASLVGGGILGIFNDITERKRAEEALQTSESLLSSIFDQGPHPMWIADSRGTLVKLNQACKDMLNVTDQELVGKYNVFEDCIVQDQGALPLVKRVFETGEAARFELRYDSSQLKHLRLARFASVIVDVTVSPIKDAAGHVVNAVFQPKDITARKKAEAELARYQEHLEELVQQRTNELRESQIKLQHTERLASIGTLAAGVAHEINNPVGGILLAAEMGRARKDNNSAINEILDSVIQNASRTQAIIENVRRFARTQTAEKVPADLYATVKQVKEHIRPIADARSCSIEYCIADGLPTLIMNATGIEQVFINLLCNAVEAGAAHLAVQIARRGDAVWIIVHDDGHGIPKEQIKHLFDPFYTTRRHQGGTGLGLSIVHGIVADHGGTIDVASEVGKGTTFTITLPIVVASDIKRE